jgi:hypothetical protein
MKAVKIEKTPFGATVTFDNGATQNFQFNPAKEEGFDAFWDWDGSLDVSPTLEAAIDDYVTYVTES